VNVVIILIEQKSPKGQKLLWVYWFDLGDCATPLCEGPRKRITDSPPDLFSEGGNVLWEGEATVIRMPCAPEDYLNCNIQSQGGSYASRITFITLACFWSSSKKCQCVSPGSIHLFFHMNIHSDISERRSLGISIGFSSNSVL